jgi:N-acetylglutamate synthase
MDIRTMTIKDYDQVFQLWNNTNGMGMRNLDDSKDGIKKYLDRNPKTNFVVIEKETVVGVIMCGHDGRRGYIYHTAVSPQFRNRGIGTLLVNTATHALKKEGITKVALVAFENNLLGNAFWENLGFEKRIDLVYRNKSLNEIN